MSDPTCTSTMYFHNMPCYLLNKILFKPNSSNFIDFEKSYYIFIKQYYNSPKIWYGTICEKCGTDFATGFKNYLCHFYYGEEQYSKI